jgi:hypothetical protein
MMMLYKRLVSFVVGLAAVSSVVAIPQGPGSPVTVPQALTPITPSKCTETLQCCTTLASVSDPRVISAAQGYNVDLDPSFEAGLHCYNIAAEDKW